MQNIARYRDAFRGAVYYAGSSPRRLLTTATVTLVFYTAMVLLSNPAYSSYVLTHPGTLTVAITDLTVGLYFSAGLLGIALTGLYAIAVGITGTVLLGHITENGVLNMIQVGGLAPGVLAGGCAGCGIGLLSLIGVSGGVALFPFSGNGVRLLGLGLVTYFLVKSGDPRTCAI